jgi:hypothetical protein
LNGAPIAIGSQTTYIPPIPANTEMWIGSVAVNKKTLAITAMKREG